jgi:HK97 family phage major capsid protein
MSQILSQHDLNIRSVLVLGDTYNAPDIALRVVKRGGTEIDFFRALMDRGSDIDPGRAQGLTPMQNDGYSLCNLIRAQAERRPDMARHERDMSAVLTTKTGKAPNGDFVPFSVFRDFNVGTATQAGNLLGSPIAGNLAGDPLRDIFTLGRLGATISGGLSNTPGIPVFGSSTEVQHVTEIAAGTSVLEETRLVTLSPRRLTAVFVCSLQAVIQSTPTLEAALRRQMATAIDEAMQKGVLAGDGTGDNPTGILNDSAVNIEVGGTDGATLVYQHLVNMEYAASVAKHPARAPGWVINPATAKYLRTKTRGTYLPEILGNDNRICAAGAEVSTVMPADLEKGAGTNLSGLVYSPDWSQLVIGIYGGGFDVTVDRVTLIDQGKLRIVVHLFYGAGLREPSAFSVMKDAALA